MDSSTMRLPRSEFVDAMKEYDRTSELTVQWVEGRPKPCSLKVIATLLLLLQFMDKTMSNYHTLTRR